MAKFRRTCFGLLLNVDLVLNVKLVHHFLFKEVKDEDEDFISFNILGKKVTVTQEYFNLISGLWPTEKELKEILARRGYNTSCLDQKTKGHGYNLQGDGDYI